MKRVDPYWRAQVDSTRTGVMKALHAISNDNKIDEEELERLHNFCLFALALMQAEGSKKWALAKMNAELMSLMRDKNT